MTGCQFRCSLTSQDVCALAKKYEQQPMRMENGAMDAGRRIREECDYTLENLMAIVEWKSGRRKALVGSNDQSEIEDALQTMVGCKKDRTRIATLVGLCGVAVPMGSAILTAFDPEQYTVIDVRALQSLQVSKPSPTIDLYLCYLDFCRETSKRLKVSLRKLDKALWQQSKDRGES